jgi:hypothetical protein
MQNFVIQPETESGKRFSTLMGNFERLATDRGTNGLYGYEEDDDFVVGDDVVDELEADVGGFFVHNPDQALSAHPVAFLPVASPPPTGARVATVGAGAVAHAATTVAPSAAAAVAAAAANVSPQFVSVPPLFDALAAFAAHWTDICAHRGDKGAPARIPNSLYPFGFDVAYQAKLAHPRRQITSDIVDEIKRLLPLEPDSIRAFLKRAFKAGVSAKSGMMATEAAALEAQILRGSGAAMPRAAITSSTNSGATAPPPLHNAVAAAAAAAAISASASAPSSAAPQPTVAEIKNAATYKKALNARQEAAAEVLATFRKTLDNDIATGKIAEPLPAGSGESDKRRQTVWRPQLKSLLSDCVEAALAVSELTFARSQFVDAGTVVQVDDKARERLRTEARDAVLRKVVEFWPEGWITLPKVRQAYSNYKRSQAPAAAVVAAAAVAAAAGGADQSQSGATQVATTQVATSSGAAAVAALTSPWKARKRFVCVYSGCSEAFNSMDPLKNHVIAAHHGGDATATLELPQHGVKLVGEFKCEVANCYETFFAIRDLRMHMTKMHLGVPLPQSPASTAAVKRSAPDSVVAAATAAESERPIKQRRKKVSSPHEPVAAAATDAVVVASNGSNDDDNDGAATATNGVDDAEFVCALCSKPAMYECTGCLSVHYCSAECQRSSWKSHMDACKLLAKAKERNNNNNNDNSAVEQ